MCGLINLIFLCLNREKNERCMLKKFFTCRNTVHMWHQNVQCAIIINYRTGMLHNYDKELSS